MATTGRLRVPGGSLPSDSSGDGPPVVLVHGFALTRAMWDDVAPSLSVRHRVIRYDCRGFGESGPPDPEVPYSHADDLLTLLDELGIERAGLVGQSFGGQVALLAALAAPERVSTLVLIDSVLDEVPWDPDSQTALEVCVARAQADGIDAGRAAWLDHPLFGPARESPALAQRLASMVATYPGHHWQGADPARPVEPHAIEILDRVTSPTTVVVGERDVPCFIEMSAILARGIPGARLVRIPGAGHMAPMEAPGAVLAALETALATE